MFREIIDGKSECIACIDIIGDYITKAASSETITMQEFLDLVIRQPNTLGCKYCMDNPCTICKESKKRLSAN